MENKTPRSPWLYIPSLYFQQGLPVVIVQNVSVILYKKMGLPNEEITLWTSLITWPWILKMLWGPLVDLHATKRGWIRVMQAAITLSLAAVAFSMLTQSFLLISLLIFLLIAFLSATHDIALDGYYMLALSEKQQAFFVGIRSTFFRLAMIFGSGVIVILAGFWEKAGIDIPHCWFQALLVSSAVYGILMLMGFFSTPKVTADHAVGATTDEKPEKETDHPSFSDAFVTFFKKDKIVLIVLMILFYRFAEVMLTKMAGLFLLDKREVGGLGIDTLQVGMIIGNVGVACLVVGGILGGFVVSKYGLKKTIWPLIITMNLPNLPYIWAAYAQPGIGFIYVLTAIEQFSYGFGLAAYLVFMMQTCQGSRYLTSHYAIATGIMALGSMFAGILSGYLQKSLGYFWFFVAVCICTIPGMVLLKFVPLEPRKIEQKIK